MRTEVGISELLTLGMESPHTQYNRYQHGILDKSGKFGHDSEPLNSIWLTMWQETDPQHDV